MITDTVDDTRDYLMCKHPRTRQQLATWISVNTSLLLPRDPACPGHQTPLDYLVDTFFEESPTGDALVWACRGGGKTMIGALATLLDLVFKPGIQVRILGGSLEQSDRMYTYLRTFFDGPLSCLLTRPPTRRRLELTNGSVAEVLAQSARSVRGTRVQKLRCDEVELFDPEVSRAAQLTTRSLPLADGRIVRGSVEALSTMHKPGGLMQKLLRESEDGSTRRTFAWCIWDVIAKCHESRNCATCPLWQDCGGRAKHAEGFVPVEDVIAMHARVSRAVWEHEMLCHPPRLEDAVFAAFRRSTHLRDWPLEHTATAGEPISCDQRLLIFETLIAGVDFGYRGAFVCLWIAILRDSSGRRVAWVVDELVTRERTLHFNVTAIKVQPLCRWPAPGHGQSAANIIAPEARPESSDLNTWRPDIVYCDVAGRAHNSQTGRTDEAVLRAAGFRVRSHAMEIEAGVAFLNELIDPALGGAGVPRLLIDSRCIRLAAALEGYRRKSDGTIDKDGTHDHLIDALRYGLVNHERRECPLEVRNY